MAILDGPSGGGGGSSGGSSDGGGSSSSGGGTGAIPTWVWSPRAKILGIVASWIAAGFYQMSIAGVDLVQTVQRWYFQAFGAAGEGVLDALRMAGASVLAVENSITNGLVDLGASTGMAGPLAAAIVFGAVMVATAVLVRWLLNALKWIT